MLGLFCAVREGMEVGEGLGDGGSREWRRGSRHKVKKDIKSVIAERGKGYRRERGAVTGHGNEEQQAG